MTFEKEYGRPIIGLEPTKGRAGLAGDDSDLMADLGTTSTNSVEESLSSVSYFPPPCAAVRQPKSDGNTRPRDSPRSRDRIAQLVVKRIGTSFGGATISCFRWIRPAKSASMQSHCAAAMLAS